MLRFPRFDEYADRVNVACTTRVGGVSEPPFDTLNLGFKPGDDCACVLENRRRAFAIFHADSALHTDGDTKSGESDFERKLSSWVSLQQVHCADVVRVTAIDAGKGALSSAFGDEGGPVARADAMYTDERGLTLAILTADCVPVFLYDPEHHALGVAHCGWRPTAAGIIRNLLTAMRRDFGTLSADVVAGVGPGICGNCYEVGSEVASHFAGQSFEGYRVLWESVKPVRETRSDGDAMDGSDDAEHAVPSVFHPRVNMREGAKYKLNLYAVLNAQLVNAGVSLGRISILPRCTCCESDLFFSHRREGERTGRMALLAEML